LPPINEFIFKDNTYLGFDFLKDVIRGSLYVAMIGAGTLPFTYMFGAFFSFLESAQELIMISYLNIELPGNLQEMLTSLRDFQFSSFVNKGGAQIKTTDNDWLEFNIPNPPLKFYQRGISSSFLVNSYNIIIFSLMVPWSLIVFVFLVDQRYGEKSNSWILRFFSMVKHWMSYNFLFFLFNNFVQEIALFVALEFYTANFDNWFNQLSFSLCLLTIIYHFGVMIWLGRLINSFIEKLYNDEVLESETFPQEYIHFFEIMDLNNKAALLYPLIRMTRKIMFAFFIVFLYDFPRTQILCCCLLNASMFAYLGFVRPLSESVRNFMSQVCECFQILIFLLLLLSKEIVSQRNASLTIGLIVIFLVMGLILMNLLAMLVSILIMCVKKICNLTLYPLQAELAFLNKIHWFYKTNPQPFAFKEFNKLRNGNIEMNVFGHMQVLTETSMQTNQVDIREIMNPSNDDSSSPYISNYELKKDELEEQSQDKTASQIPAQILAPAQIPAHQEKKPNKEVFIELTRSKGPTFGIQRFKNQTFGIPKKNK